MQLVLAAAARLGLKALTSAVRVFDETTVGVHKGPVLFVANHISSADTWVAIGISRGLGRRPIVLAQQRVLDSFPLLRLGGFVGLDQHKPFEVLAAFRRVSGLARSSSSVAIWVFPQGTHRPSGAELGSLRPGVASLVRLLPPETLVVPVGFHYFVYRQPRMAISAVVGPPLGEAGNLAKLGASQLMRDLHDAVKTAEATAATRVDSVAAAIRFPFESRKPQLGAENRRSQDLV